MGETLRCTRCKKGIREDEKIEVIDDKAYHFKCARKVRK